MRRACWAAMPSASAPGYCRRRSPALRSRSGSLPRRRHVDSRQPLPGFRLGLERCETKRGRLQRRDGGVQARVRGDRRRSPAATEAATADHRPRRCAPACPPLAGDQKCRLRRPYTPRSTGSAHALRPASESNRRLCAPCARTGRAARQRAATPSNPPRSERAAGTPRRWNSGPAMMRLSARRFGAPARAVGRRASEWAYRETASLSLA